MSAPDMVIHEALIALIVQLTARVEELEVEVNRRKDRAWELRVGLNNLLCLANTEEVRRQYQAILDREDD